MRKLLLLMMVLLTLGGSGAWADVLPSAVVGTYEFQATTLTTGASGNNITKDGSGNVTISANSGTYGPNSSSRFTCTLVIKINVPETTTAGVLCDIRTAANSSTKSNGLYMQADRVLKTCYDGRAYGSNSSTLTTGEHTIVYNTSNDGGYVYVDGTQAIFESGLKVMNNYTVIYIPNAYAQYVTEVHFYPTVLSSDDRSSIFTECGNHMHASQQSGESVTVPSGKILVIDTDANLSKFSGASSIDIASGITLSLDKDEASISLSGSGTALQSSDITTTVTGNLPALTLKATAGTLNYTGKSDAEPTLNGTTLSGVTLAGSKRIHVTGNITIENLAGNNQSSGTNTYAFYTDQNVSVTLKGNCDFTKKSDETASEASYIGVNKGGVLTIVESANVKVGNLYNSTTLANNANITIESSATLEVTGYCDSPTVTNNGTLTMGGPLTTNSLILNEGSTINISGSNLSGATNVSGNATLNATGALTLSQAITVAADKTLTIDCASNAVNLNVVPTMGSGSKINFQNATINYNNSIRNLASYTFTSCTAQFVETGDEYKVGGFTIMNVPDGATIKVKKYDATDYETVTPEAGTATISHEVGVSGLAAWLDYTFNESTKATNIHSPADAVITNAGNAGSGNNLTIDSGYNTANSYNDDGTLKVMSTPYRDITWPTNYTVAVAGNVPDVENGCLVAFGSSTNGSKNYLAIIRGASQNEIKLVKGHEMNNAFEVISTMTAANATALSHLVVFTKNGNTFTVYLDGVQKTQVTYSDALGGGFQIGSLHGGVTGTGVGRVNDMSADIKAKVFAKAIRVYDYVISSDQMEALTEEFPYTSFGGKYSRTITANSNLSATDAWLNAGTQGNVDVPVNAIVDEVAYYPDVEITTTAASTLTVNADMDAENIKFDGAGKLTIASDGEHNIHIYGSLTANGPISVKYGETDLSAVPVTIGESGSIEFDFSASDFSSVNAPTDYPVTGNTADYGSKVTGVYPSDIYHTYTLAYNGSTNSYYLTVAPSVALKQQQAIDLVTPYYNGNHVGAGVGKYTISLGETSYAYLADFENAVMSWATIGDCVEPTIAINQPTSAFYRIKSGSKYLQDVRKSDSATQRTMTDTDGAETIFYLNGNTLVGYKTGFGFGYSVCQTQDTEHLNTQLFTESDEMGKYTIQSQQGTCTSANYNEGFWGVDNSDLSRVADAASGACWTIESVTTLPVNFKGQFASFYSPVDLEIPDGVKVYIGTLNGDKLLLSEITGTLPHATGVILEFKGYSAEATDAENTKEFNILSTSTDGTSDLLGTTAAQTVPENSKLVLGKNGENWGIYKYGGTTLGGFKAYMEMPASGSVKGFAFTFGDADAIANVLNGEEKVNEVYDLSGRRVNVPARGLYIVNGKKVVIK